jgi:replicative DNA helicase
MSERNSIKSALERELYIDEAVEYASKNLTQFGNAFLDDALHGMLPNDLCLLSAKSGYGKTQIATSIAAYNASVCKKNVVFIALEAEHGEIEMRLKYQCLAGLYFRDQNRDRSVTVSYRKWRLGFLTQVLKKYAEEAIVIFTQRYATLYTVYRHEHYDVTDLERTLEEAKDFGDLFLFDHLSYADQIGHENETAHMSKLIKKIRSLNLYYNKPFVVVAHLRKGIEGIVPQLEDIYGSSDVGKNCTVAFMVAKDPEGYDAKNQLQKTIISIPKARTGGLGNLVAQVDYSIQHQMYLPRYSLARVIKYKDKEKIERLDVSEYPEWCSQAHLQITPPAKV